MQDHELDTDLGDGGSDTPGDTDTDFDESDKHESGDRTSADDTGDDGGSNEPDDDGYTAAERAELEKLRERNKQAGDKISQDGQEMKKRDDRIAELEKENAALKQNGSDTDDRPTRRTRTRQTDRNTRRPVRTRDDGSNADDQNSGLTPELQAAINKLPVEQRQIFAGVWDMAVAAQRSAREVDERTGRLETAQEAFDKQKASDEQYQSYQEHYGLTREQFDEVMEARSSGDHFQADQLLTIHSSATKRRQQREEAMADESPYLSPGSPNTPEPTGRKSLADRLKDEFEAAETPEEQQKVAQKVWATVPADVAEAITMPDPVS